MNVNKIELYIDIVIIKYYELICCILVVLVDVNFVELFLIVFDMI